MTRREFVHNSSRAGVTIAAAAFLRGLSQAAGFSTTRTIEGKDVISVKGAIATEAQAVEKLGATILARGGNAIDAAAAACLAGCMVHPHLSDLGGYVCCAVVLEAKSDRVWSLDANAIAPAAAHERMFTVMPVGNGPAGINENEYSCRVQDNANVHGPLAVATPGAMAGIGRLWERWGSLKWPEIVAPSLELLEAGIPYGSTADAIRLQQTAIRKFETTARHLMPDGNVPKPAQTWHRQETQKVLRRIASSGWRDFYEGEIGRRIADYITSIGGILTRNDMASFEPRVTEPYAITYRDAKVYGAVLPNGGLSSLQILNMLECFEPVQDNTVIYWHRLAEILKLVWRDRLLYLGDPAFSKVPIRRLLSEDYAAGRVETIRQFPDFVDKLVPSLPNASAPGTLHVSTADVHGNLVAVTISHGSLFGSCLTVPELGIILGHGMCRFDPHPGLVNSVGPRKRPLNNVCPTILRMPDRDVALGLRGGRRIVNVSAQLAHRMIDFKAASTEAAVAPRIHVQAKEPGEIASSLEKSILAGLAAMGHILRPVTNLVSGAHCAEFLKKERKVRAGGNPSAGSPQ